jgi:hypothetical protein
LHQLKPNRQRNGFYPCGCDEEKRYKELRGNEIFLIGPGSVVKVDITPRSFSGRAENLCVVDSHDNSISTGQLDIKQDQAFDNLPAVKRAIFNRFVVAGPKLSDGDSKAHVRNMAGRSNESAQDKLKECRPKFQGKSEKQKIDPMS